MPGWIRLKESEHTAQEIRVTGTNVRIANANNQFENPAVNQQDIEPMNSVA